jgi:hypothetical protein
MEAPNAEALGQRFLTMGLASADIVRLFRSFNGYADPFRVASDRFEELNP